MRGAQNHPPVVMRGAENHPPVVMRGSQNHPSVEMRGAQNYLPVVMRTTALPVKMECQDLLGQRDPLALLDLKAAKAHVDPLANMASLETVELPDEPLALVGLFMYTGDEPPVLTHLEQSWCTQEKLEGAIGVTVVEEQTNSVYQITHST